MSDSPQTTRHEIADHVVTVTILGEPEVPKVDHVCGGCGGRADAAFTYALTYDDGPASVTRVVTCFACASGSDDTL